ncbi:MAG: acyl-CoA/acyl-ACP dehydrogenase [Actinomycetota bacterium]|nr:acyl-CoA/acyl-ACP dehydrogenase [Actinomycetota bacterium]
MDFELSDEQHFLRDAARGALSRHNTVAAARAALDGEERLDLWDTAREAGWPGLLIDEDRGGAGLGGLDAMLVMIECGRVLASVPLLGHVPATGLLAAARGHDELLAALAEGERRAVLVPAQPPGDLDPGWTVDAPRGHARRPAPRAVFADGATTVTGTVSWVPDAPDADVLVVIATGEDGSPIALVVEADQPTVTCEAVVRYDATRSLGHVYLDQAVGTPVGVEEGQLRSAWHLGQGLVAAESLGAVEAALESSVAYAKERFTFGRAIGSYQAVKHALVEVLRLRENARSLIYYAGWARQDAPDEFPLAASAARVAAGKALDYAARELISVHGGIGATWEHDAPLYFRRAQLSRRLLGGRGGATDRVAGLLLAGARAA